MGEEWAFHFHNHLALGFPLHGGELWTWWASKPWMEALNLACLDHPGIVHKPGVRSAQLSDQSQVLARGQQVDFPCRLCPNLLCDPGWASHPLTPSSPLPQNPSQTSLLGFTGNFLRSISASKGPSLLNPAPKRRTEDKVVF